MHIGRIIQVFVLKSFRKSASFRNRAESIPMLQRENGRRSDFVGQWSHWLSSFLVQKPRQKPLMDKLNGSSASKMEVSQENDGRYSGPRDDVAYGSKMNGSEWLEGRHGAIKSENEVCCKIRTRDTFRKGMRKRL